MFEGDPLLGAPLANYPSDRGRPLLLAAFISVPAAIVLNFTLAALPTWWGPALAMVLMGLLVLALGWYVLHVWNREVILYEHGFSYREGSHTVYFLYHEVRSIRQQAERLAYLGGLFRRTVYRFTVTTIRDETFILTNVYRRIAELGVRLEQHVNKVLEPEIIRRLDANEIVPFAATFSLSNQGMHEGERFLPWSQFGSYRIQHRQLVLTTRSGETWYAIPLGQVDNITILLNLLRQKQPVVAVDS